MMRRSNFVVFILTHGRADNVYTYRALKREGYTGRVVFVIDDEDEQAERYRIRYGAENVYQFNKREAAGRMDACDNSGNRKAILFARNECFRIARELGYRYFLELDDDYTGFAYRYASKDGKPKEKKVSNLDRIFDLMLDFLDASRATSVAFIQGGDCVGGKDNDILKNEKLKRKAMNSFFCDVEKEFAFRGRMNDDVNTYLVLGAQGNLFFSVPHVCIHQMQTQSTAGGMSDVYRESGTYVKSFYTIMNAPSCVKIALMGNKEKRLHHNIEWNNAVPCIVAEKYKKL